MSRRLLMLALALPVLGGCATKRDLRDLRVEVDALRSSQEAMLRAVQQQNATLLDSINSKDVRLRGYLSNQMVQIERQLVQIQELTGQGQQRLAELREAVRTREEALRSVPQEPGGAPPTTGDPEELLAASREALDRGSFATARAGFDEFLRAFSRHPRAPDAQLYIGEAFEKAQDLPRALEAYARVLELYPNSTAAPTALFRSASIEAGRDNRDRARTMLNQLIAAYPRSPEEAEARRQLQRLR